MSHGLAGQAKQISGNTAGATAIISSGTFVLAGGNNITLSQNANSVTISAGAGGAGDGVNILAAGTQTANTTGTVVFSNSNGLAFGMSNNSVITGSYTVPTVTNSSWTVSDNATSMTIGRLAFTNSNGLTMTLSTTTGGNATLIGSYTVPTVTNSSMTVSDAGTSGTLARLAFTNLNGVTLSLSTGAGGSHTIVGSHNALTSQSNQAFSAAGGSSAFQTLGFSDNAKVSFTNTNGSVGIASVRASLFAASNTTQGTSGTQNLDAITFAGAGIASVGVTNGSVLISVPAGGGAGDGVNIIAAGTQTANTTGSVVFSNSNGISFGMSNSSVVTASYTVPTQTNQTVGIYAVSNTTQSSSATLDARSFSFNGAGLVSVGATNGSVVISASNSPMSFYQNAFAIQGTQSQTLGNSTSVVFPFDLPQAASADYVRFPVTMGTSSTSFVTTANTAFSCSLMSTHNVVIYKQGAGANSLSLQSVASGSAGFTQQWSLTANSTGTQYTVSYRLSYPNAGATSSYSTSVAVSAANFNLSSNSLTLFTGQRFIDVGLSTLLTEGNYWMAYGVSSTNSTQASPVMTGLRLTYSNLAISQVNAAFGSMGVDFNASVQAQPGIGSYTTNNQTTASIAFANISSSASHNFPIFQLVRFA